MASSREYPTVLKLSRDPDALLNAHATMISRDLATATVYSYLDEDNELPVLDFTATTMRGRAWPVTGRIRLPESESMLTLGTVLHEIAHIIEYKDKGTIGHGINFINVLDDLVRSEVMWKEQPYESI